MYNILRRSLLNCNKILINLISLLYIYCTIKLLIQSTNKNKYLSSIILIWYTKQLQLLNFDINNLFTISQKKQTISYCTIYKNFRKIVYNYIKSKIKSRLTFSNKLYRNCNWQFKTNIEDVLKIDLVHNRLKKLYNTNIKY